MAARDARLRAQCLCDPTAATPPELAIVLINGKCFLRRLPHSGTEHTAECSHFEVDPTLSGRGELNAAINFDPDAGTTTIKLDFALRGERDARPVGEATEPTLPDNPAIVGGKVTKRSPKGLSLLGTLHLWWDLAQLNRWWSAMEGKRFYGIVARELTAAAIKTRTARNALSDLLLVPKYAKAGDTLANDIAVGALIDRLRHRGDRYLRGMVVGELSHTDRGYNVPRLHLNYLGEPLRIEGSLLDRLYRRQPEIEDWMAKEEEDHAMVIALVHAEARQLLVDQIAVMRCDPHWIPRARSGLEQAVINHLNREGRGYQAVLDHDSKGDDIKAAAILLDTPEPVPLFVIRDPDDSDIESKESRQRYQDYVDRVESIRENEYPNALLFRRDDIPELPPRRQKPPKPANQNGQDRHERLATTQ